MICPIRHPKDYVFDIDRFTSFEGDTGPYILYTIVRIKSILNKYKEQGGDLTAVKLQQPGNASEKELAMELAQFNTMMLPLEKNWHPIRYVPIFTILPMRSTTSTMSQDLR